MSLTTLVTDELEKLRAMSIADIRQLPEQVHRDIEKTWKHRSSVSIYVERVDEDAVRVIVKAFDSVFPHVSTNAHAEGFRLCGDGRVEPLTEADMATLY